jgi:hypothetical protein
MLGDAVHPDSCSNFQGHVVELNNRRLTESVICLHTSRGNAYLL